MGNNKSSSSPPSEFELYIKEAKSKMETNFVKHHPCLGLHFGFGKEETEKVTKHLSSSSSLNSTVLPFDVLLRTLTFIPHPADPRFSLEEEEKQDPLLTRRRLTLFRLASSCKTLLFTILENKCVATTTKTTGQHENEVPKEDQDRAKRIYLTKYQTIMNERRKKLQTDDDDDDDEIDRMNAERDRDYAHHLSHGGTERDYEGLPRLMKMTKIAKIAP